MEKLNQELCFSVDPGFNDMSLHHNRNVDSNVTEVPAIV